MLLRKSNRVRATDRWRVHLEVMELDRRDQPSAVGPSTILASSSPQLLIQPVPLVAPPTPLFPGVATPVGSLPGAGPINSTFVPLASPPLSPSIVGPPTSIAILTNRDSGYAEPTDLTDISANPSIFIPPIRLASFLENETQTAGAAADEHIDWTAAATATPGIDRVDLSGAFDSATAAGIHGVFVGPDLDHPW